jgi:hypothetical protein
LGDPHDPQVPASTLQEKVEPDSDASKEKDALVEVVGEVGWAVIEVSGGVVSAGGGVDSALCPRPGLTGQRRLIAIPLERPMRFGVAPFFA